MDHAVDLVLQTDEEAKLGDRFYLAFDKTSDRMRCGKRLPRIVHALFETQRYTALVGIDFQHLDFHFLRRLNDLRGCDVFLHPRHFRDVHQAFDARLEFDEGTVVGDVRDLSLEAHAGWIFGADPFPRIGLQLLHAERDTLRLMIDLDDLHGHRLADIQDFCRMADATPGDV